MVDGPFISRACFKMLLVKVEKGTTTKIFKFSILIFIFVQEKDTFIKYSFVSLKRWQLHFSVWAIPFLMTRYKITILCYYAQSKWLNVKSTWKLNHCRCERSIINHEMTIFSSFVKTLPSYFLPYSGDNSSACPPIFHQEWFLM